MFHCAVSDVMGEACAAALSWKLSLFCSSSRNAAGATQCMYYYMRTLARLLRRCCFVQLGPPSESSGRRTHTLQVTLEQKLPP